MALEGKGKKLTDLLVVELRSELEKRNLDKTGIKAVLVERLVKVLKEEGHDPETYVFESQDKKPPRKSSSRRSDGEESETMEVSEEDIKDERQDEEEEVSSNKSRKESEDNTNQPADIREEEEFKEEDMEVRDEVTEEEEEEIKDDSMKIVDEVKEEEGKENENAKSENGAEKQKHSLDGTKEVSSEASEKNKLEEKKIKSGGTTPTSVKKNEAENANKQTTDVDKSPSKNKTTAVDKSPSKIKTEEGKAKTENTNKLKETKPVETTVKEEKQAPEANGVVDNEDSINLTIGEDEEKLLADEEDSCQEKDNKDESHVTADLHSKSSSNTTAGEKTQDKINQEKTEVKSGVAGEKISKDDKGKKSASNSSRNLWVSGLSSTTRATDLKQVFSKFGKVIGAKVVTNARTPGARCYGYVTMASSEDATKSIQFLHLTELHGRMISVEKAKGDSTGPPRREAVKPEVAKKPDEKKKDRVVKPDEKKEETIIPPGTESEVIKTEPAAPGTENDVKKESTDKDSTKGASKHRSRAPERSDRDKRRPRSTASSHHRSHDRNRSEHRKTSPNILTFSKIKEERDRQRLRERERQLREEERRRETERQRQREVGRKQREEFARLDREREKLKLEREKLDRERVELLRLKRERQRLERERQRIEREKLEWEREELEKLKRENLKLEEERRKRSLSGSRDREYEDRKRPATERRVEQHSRARYSDSRPEFKKESVAHKTDTNSRRYEDGRERWEGANQNVREEWQKDRESNRYSERGGAFRNQDDTVQQSQRIKSESRHPRERYQDSAKGDRYIERQDTWHGSNTSANIKTFSAVGGGVARDQWIPSNADHKTDSPAQWSQPANKNNRWGSGGGGPMGMNNRMGPQMGPGSMYPSNMDPGVPGMGMGIVPFGGGDRFDAYKQPYFKIVD